MTNNTTTRKPVTLGTFTKVQPRRPRPAVRFALGQVAHGLGLKALQVEAAWTRYAQEVARG
jgi:hypothetical protein